MRVCVCVEGGTGKPIEPVENDTSPSSGKSAPEAFGEGVSRRRDRKCKLRQSSETWGGMLWVYRDTSLMRNNSPPRTTRGP